MDAARYQSLLDKHGRRVANRAVFEALRDEGISSGHEAFHSMYGPESNLSEGERCTTGVVDEYDPAGRSAFYSRTAWATSSPNRIHWAKEMDESHPDSVEAIKQVVTMSNAERAAYVAALPEGDWRAAVEAMTDADLLDIWIILYRQWPQPVRGTSVNDPAIPNEREMALRHMRVLGMAKVPSI
jgi:hypothetical protein